MRLSVVIPTLNEATRIAEQVARTCALPGVDEVIVVDGGSTDGTLDCLDGFDVIALQAARGRATQMNRGAQAATGDVLMFLHADVELPENAAALLERVLDDPDCVGGAFLTKTVSEPGLPQIGPLLWLADFRSRYTGLPYGDQALFVRREVFDAAQGFPEQALMEDLEFSRRLRKLGRLVTVREPVRVSGRRFQQRPVTYCFMSNFFPLLYRLGMPTRLLSRWWGVPR